MKFKRFISIVLTTAITLPLLTVSSSAKLNTIYNISKSTYQAAYNNEAVYTVQTGKYSSSTAVHNQRIYTLEFKPGSTLRAVTTSGSAVYGRSTLTAKMNYLSSKLSPGESIVGGINADFFALSNGIAFGIQIENGRLISTNDRSYDASVSRYSVGFKQDGQVLVGIPGLQMGLSNSDASINISLLNRLPNKYHTVLLTEDYGSVTTWQTGGYCYDVIDFRVIGGDQKIGGKLTVEYVNVHRWLNTPLTIEKGHVYLVQPSRHYDEGISPQLETLAQKLVSQRQAEITFQDKTGDWGEIVNATGAGNLLVNNGEVYNTATYDSAIKTSLTSRSALGIKKDGTVVFYAVEGKSANSAGLPMTALAQALVDMGCVKAVNLDGGGSTTLAVRKSQSESPVVLNACQDGAQRAVANCIFLVDSGKVPDMLDNMEKPRDYLSSGEGVTAVYVDDPTLIYSGDKALMLNYDLASADLFAPIMLKTPITVPDGAVELSIYVSGNGSNNVLQAIFQTAEGYEYRDVASLAKNNVYSQYIVKDMPSSKLAGWRIVGKGKGRLFIDQITAVYHMSISDSRAPVIKDNVAAGTVLSAEKKLVMSASDNSYGSGVDTSVLKINMNNTPLAVSINDRTATAKLTNAAIAELNMVRYDAADKNGNRSISYVILPGQSYNNKTIFSDVTIGKWDALHIDYCEKSGIISGYKENGKYLYKGSKNVTRAEYCVMSVNLAGFKISDYAAVKLPFADLEQIPAWALPYIKAAYTEGIMSGSIAADGKLYFYPHKNISRNEAAVMASSMLAVKAGMALTRAFTDADTIAQWAKEQVDKAAAYGIIVGNDGGYFSPSASLTRSQAAVIMSKLKNANA